MKPRIILTRLFALVFILFSVVIFSCTKESSSGGTDSEEQEVSEISSESDAEAEIIFNGIFDDVMGVSDDVGMGGIGVFGREMRPQACYTLSIEHPGSTPFPVKVTIDFGPTPCMGQDGHTRSGKIVALYTGRLIVPGMSATTTFENFIIDSIKVTGTHKITNTSSVNQPVSRQFKVEVINAKLTKHTGNYIEWNCNKTITQIEGLITPDMPRDDAFKIEGTSRGKALRGNILVAWQSSIAEPLIKKFLCPWIVKGIIKSMRANVTSNDPRWHSTLNFGNGGCDRKATLTINGVSTEITLR
jgi:hypothetical protein